MHNKFFVYFFKDILKTKFVRTPLEVMNKFVNKIFVAKLVKFSPYRDEIVNFQNGKARVTLKTKGVRTHKKYHCDLFGCGLQAVTMEMNPLEEDNYLVRFFLQYSVIFSLTCFHALDVHDYTTFIFYF